VTGPLPVTNAEDPGPSGRGSQVPLRSRPVVQILAVSALSLLLARGLLPDASGAAIGRLIVLPVGLLLVVRGILGLVELGRSEWRGRGPSSRSYLAVVAQFAVAFLILAVASS